MKGIRYGGRTYQVRDGVVYLCKISKAGEYHWARAPHTYHRVIAAVLALHEKENEKSGCAA
jgi:hypothetical protein